MAAQLQTLLRFLSQDAKIPLVTAMSKVKELQNEGLKDPESIAKADIAKLQSIFGDEKLVKQVVNAAKRASKKRSSLDVSSGSPPKKGRRTMDEAPATPAEVEASLKLPSSDLDEEALSKVVVVSNRAPLVLAFVVTLLKYTMPEQPLSSRLSLSQGYVSITSRSRAVYLGLESGKSAEEDGYGKGQPFVKIMGHDIRIMRRWGYDWRQEASDMTDGSNSARGNGEDDDEEERPDGEEAEPALWALDLEHLKKATESNPSTHVNSSNVALPIYTPQSARAYIAKAFNTLEITNPEETTAKKKKPPSAAALSAQRETNLGHVLKALDLLYASWAPVVPTAELDRRTWSWYVAARPAVADGVAGWGGKNVIPLSKILDLRRPPGDGQIKDGSAAAPASSSLLVEPAPHPMDRYFKSA